MNAGAQLQTFFYLKASKTISTLIDFMAMLRSQPFFVKK